MNDFQKQLYGIFLETKRVCEKLGIKLIACGGTLLGAARHQGFIPWDDDMDFYMLRDDYEKFCKEGQKIFNKDYFVQCHKTDHDWWFPFAKVRKNNTCAIEKWFIKGRFHHGLWIDIFPLDKQISDKQKLLKDEIKRRSLFGRVKYTYAYRQMNCSKKIDYFNHNKRILLRYPLLGVSFNKLERLAKKYQNIECELLGSVWDDKTKEKNCMLFEKQLFEEFIELPFEKTTVLANKKYDKVLTIQYGDWRKLPPKNEQVVKHAIIKIDFYNSYEKYI